MGKIVHGILLLLLVSFSEAAENSNGYLLHTKILPDDLNFMPTMGNGHLGYTVFGDSIYMNGIYNGQGGNSRRARIPNWMNISVSDETIDALALLTPNYEMDLRAGYFRWTHASASGDMILEQRIYPHRYYTRSLIYDLSLQRSNTNGSFDLKLLQRPGNKSDAFDFVFDSRTTNDSKMLIGRTRLVEHEQFQKSSKRIFIVFSDYWKDEKILHMPAGQQLLKYRCILTFDERRAVAQHEMVKVLQQTPEELLTLHAMEWEAFWHNFNIEINNNLELIINAGIFYIASSLPALHSFQLNAAYYGLSPTGLGRGRLEADYEGHSFWDTEIWMLPLVTQLSYNWTRELFHYRLTHMEGAQYNAQLTGYRGARYPWESAYTGTEVTQPCCPEVAAQEVHISADIVIALDVHYATCGDRSWLCDTAWPLSTEIAKFLESRVEFDIETQKFHINNVMGPDEDHWNVSDNVYTNVAFKRALEFASFTEKICAAENVRTDIDQWLNISQNLHICYDDKLDYHPEYVNYERGVEVKQADVVLLGYPLQFSMNKSTQQNDLEYYEHVIRSSGPAMSWSMFAINFMDINDWTKADTYFQQGFQDYVRSPFNVWSETKRDFEGSANFLTGIGGFLQALLNGYAGLRFQRNGLNSIMEIRAARLAPKTSSIAINGIKFVDATFALHISSNFTTLKCTQLGENDLIFTNGEYHALMQQGISYIISNKFVRIETVIE